MPRAGSLLYRTGPPLYMDQSAREVLDFSSWELLMYGSGACVHKTPIIPARG